MKKALRHNLRERRKALSPVLHAEKSAAIRAKLEGLSEFISAEKILVYLSKDDEVATHELIQDCLAQGRLVFAPRVQGEHMVICPVNNWEELSPGEFDILEPCQAPDPAHPSEMDLILVPGIGFDRRGHRLGYGRGFYDKILKLTEGFKVGLAFSEQVVDEVPTESHDVALDLIITDSDLIYP